MAGGDTTAYACELLPWDTEFWGIRIGKTLPDILTKEVVERIDQWCQLNLIDCLYFLARSDDAATTSLAGDCGFRLVDIRVTLRHGPVASFAVRGGEDHYPVLIRESRLADVPALERIAGVSHRHTRFYYDRSFPRHLCDSLYKTWIRGSCEGDADVVLVAEVDAEPAGYVACHIDEQLEAGRIGLLGVGDRVRGRGVGQALVRASLMWFREHLARTITVVTQGRNCVAQRLYQRHGFLTDDVRLWYHKWYSRPPHE